MSISEFFSDFGIAYVGKGKTAKGLKARTVPSYSLDRKMLKVETYSIIPD